MSDFEVKDRVQDVIWDGRCVGTVVDVHPAGWPDVLWDGEVAPELMMPHQVVRIEQRQEAA